MFTVTLTDDELHVHDAVGSSGSWPVHKDIHGNHGNHYYYMYVHLGK